MPLSQAQTKVRKISGVIVGIIVEHKFGIPVDESSYVESIVGGVNHKLMVESQLKVVLNPAGNISAEQSDLIINRSEVN